MQAILLLDTNGGPCSDIGRQIAAEGLLDDSPVALDSLHDDVLRKQVQAVRPDAKWEPMLLKQDGDSRTVATGLRLAVELAAMLGIRRSYRISQLIREMMDREGVDASRRSFLNKFASAADAVPVLGVGRITLQLDKPKKENETLTRAHLVRAYHTVLSSTKFVRVRRMAYRDARLIHNRDYSDPVSQESAPGTYMADTYGGFLIPDTGRERLITLIRSPESRKADGFGGTRLDRVSMSYSASAAAISGRSVR